MTLQLTADGKTVFCGGYGGNTEKKSSDQRPEIFEYSLATGAGRLVYRLKVAAQHRRGQHPLAEPDGSSLLAAAEATDYRVRGRVIQGERIVARPST